MRSIVYTSTQTRPITDIELAQILAVGRERNTSLGVTGILAHKGDNCLGILEGDDAVVGARFEQVRADPRHTNVRVLMDEQIVARSFPDWSMAFQPIDPLMEQVSGFTDLFVPGRPIEATAARSRVRGLLEWFRKHPLAPLTSRTADEDETPRTRVINGAILALHDDGVSRFSIDVAAAHAAMSPAQVRELFPTEQALLAATVERWSQAIAAPLVPLMAEKGTVAFLHALLAAQAEETGLVALLAHSLVSAADPTVDGADYYRSIYRRFRESIRDGLTADVLAGREPETMDPVRGAQQLLALYDGLRLQAMLTADTDLVDAFDRAASRMRRGWSEQYEQPTYWDIPVAEPR
ncbi:MULTISPECIES: BLUF domain-containing protein [unclassified Curtobacterium]|uniref:BLUF domain-containing protein n=1 Tax=unclassified Curtobacterium TaxID=257496 RepID=UPI000824A9CD|nr:MULTISPECIES: BLUF domain-containing protein [unclassified Curtobacterium]WIB00370.1 BLUF domain-containing protein [Curtobacterium sp. MCBA15_012]